MKENVNHFLILFIFLGKEGDSKRDETRVETNIYYQGKKYRNIAQGSFHFRTHNMLSVRNFPNLYESLKG